MKKLFLVGIISLFALPMFAGVFGCVTNGEYSGEKFCINEYGTFVAYIYDGERLVTVKGKVVSYDGSSIDFYPGMNERVIFKLNSPIDGHYEVRGTIGWAENGQKFVDFDGVIIDND